MIGYRNIFYIVTFLLVSAFSSFVSYAFSPEESVFVSFYQKAVNSKDVERLKSLIHPASLACMNENNKDYFDYLFAKDMRHVLPDNAKFSFSKVTSRLEPSVYEDFPVQPTTKLQLDYSLSKDSSNIHEVTKIVFLAKDAEKLKIVMPCPTEEGMKKFREVQAVKDEQAEQTKERLVSIPPELKSELLVMLKAGQKIDAIKHYREKTGVGLAEAKDFIELLQKDMSK